MFNVYMDGRDDSLIMSDSIVIENNIINLAPDYLNKEEAEIDKKREDELKNKVRYESGRFNSIIVLYSNTAEDDEYGLLNVKHMKSVIDLEQRIIGYNKVNNEFKNKKFNG